MEPVDDRRHPAYSAPSSASETTTFLSTNPFAAARSGFGRSPPISDQRMEEFPEPGLLSDDELFELRDEIAEELHWLCLRRWVLFDHIDLLRSETVRRLRESFAAGATASALAGEPEFRLLGGWSGASW